MVHWLAMSGSNPLETGSCSPCIPASPDVPVTCVWGIGELLFVYFGIGWGGLCCFSNVVAISVVAFIHDNLSLTGDVQMWRKTGSKSISKFLKLIKIKF